MAYVTIPKDLTKVKSKVLFGLTRRQLICFGAAVLVGVPLFFLLKNRVASSAAALCMTLIMLAELLNTESDMLLSIHIRSMDQTEAIKTVKRKITDIDGMKIDAQKRAVREGFDMDIVPTDIATYAVEAKNILRDLQSRNERMFLVTFLVVNMADTKRKLDNDIARAASVAQQYNCQFTRLDFQQEQGFVSALPLGANQIHIQRGLTTSAVSILMPFTTQEIFQGGDALYYGINASSGNMILADRKQNKTPNGLIL